MTVRFARHTNNLEIIKTFYITILGLELLGDFKNHNNYDGIFIGIPNENWHLEFTKSNSVVNFVFDEDDILVFYPNSKKEFDAIIEKILVNSIKFIQPKNQYWIENGKMILDPDGYRIVISPLKINK
jgi:hypothetical protein